MFRLLLLSSLLMASNNANSEVCEGLKACTELYTQMTGNKLEVDKTFPTEMSFAVPSATLESKNATQDLTNFLNMNAVAMRSNGQVMAMRHGEFLTAPIYVVTPGNMPMMINKDGLVTMVYQAKRPTKKLVTSKIRKLLSKKKTKSVNKIVEFSDTGIIATSDTFEHATKIMTAIMKSDTL